MFQGISRWLTWPSPSRTAASRRTAAASVPCPAMLTPTPICCASPLVGAGEPDSDTSPQQRGLTRDRDSPGSAALPAGGQRDSGAPRARKASRMFERAARGGESEARPPGRPLPAAPCSPKPSTTPWARPGRAAPPSCAAAPPSTSRYVCGFERTHEYYVAEWHLSSGLSVGPHVG